MHNHHYDYIIAGAGLSGLSLAQQIIQRPPLNNKKGLIIDQSLEPDNNKTWSFWHSGSPPFKKFIYKSWTWVTVAVNNQTMRRPLKEYAYHSIHSGEFRRGIIKNLRNHSTVDLIEAPIRELQGFDKHAQLKTADTQYTAPYIFQSCFMPQQLKDETPKYPLIQHFLGWEINAANDIFDPSTVTLMDFDSGFTDGIAFIYILPETRKKALLEYTIFSENLKPKEFYEEKLRLYLHNKYNLRPLDYAINRTESGQIPMQDYPYVPLYNPRIINMGTVGGLTKPSTGYTFSRIQTHVDAIIRCLITNKMPALPHRSSLRYRAYDLWLLHILYTQPQKGLKIFEELFNNNSMDDVFRFLTEENTLWQDFKTMSSVSYPPFLQAMWKTKKRLIEL